MRHRLHDPAVFRVTITEDNVYAYLNDVEEEFIVWLPDTARPLRVLDGEDLAAEAEVHQLKQKTILERSVPGADSAPQNGAHEICPSKKDQKGN